MWIQFINPLSMDIMDSLNLHTQKKLSKRNTITKCGCNSLVLFQWTNEFTKFSLSYDEWNQWIQSKSNENTWRIRTHSSENTWWIRMHSCKSIWCTGMHSSEITWPNRDTFCCSENVNVKTMTEDDLKNGRTDPTLILTTDWFAVTSGVRGKWVAKWRCFFYITLT